MYYVWTMEKIPEERGPSRTEARRPGTTSPDLLSASFRSLTPSLNHLYFYFPDCVFLFLLYPSATIPFSTYQFLYLLHILLVLRPFQLHLRPPELTPPLSNLSILPSYTA